MRLFAISDREQQFNIALVVAGLGVVMSVLIAFSLWQQAQQRENTLVKNISSTKAQLIEHQYIITLPTILKALERMKERWVARQAPPFEEWQSDAQNYVNDHEVLRAVDWINSDYIVKWVVPLKGNESTLGLDLTFEKSRKISLDVAKQTRQYQLSKPIDLIQGGKGFLAVFPIYIEQDFDGFIIGVFDINAFITHLLPQDFITEFNIVITSNNEILFTQLGDDSPFNTDTGHKHTFSLYNIPWEIAIWPQRHQFESVKSNTYLIALIGGLVVSLLLGASLFYVIRAVKAEQEIQSKDIAYKATVDNAIDGIITLDDKGIIRSSNSSAGHIFGYQKDEMLNQHISQLIQEPTLAAYESPLALSSSPVFAKTHEFNIRRHVIGKRKSAELFPMEIGISDYRTNEQTYFCGVVRDITEQQQLENERETLIEQLKKSNEELDGFAYIASHDLKEPLRAIQNHAQFLIEDYHDKLEEDGVYKLQRLVYLSSRMERLISELMYYSRLGREQVCLSQVDMNKVVSDVLNRLRERINEKNIRVEHQPLPTIYGDKVRLEELLYNLVSNACKYNTSANKQVEIGFDTSTTAAGAFYVKDNGIGIAEQFKTEVFRIFKRLNSIKKFGEGSGAGLTFAKKIVEQHNGEIWLESAPEQGTCFYFTLNLMEKQNAEQQVNLIG